MEIKKYYVFFEEFCLKIADVKKYGTPSSAVAYTRNDYFPEERGVFDSYEEAKAYLNNHFYTYGRRDFDKKHVYIENWEIEERTFTPDEDGEYDFNIEDSFNILDDFWQELPEEEEEEEEEDED